MAADGIASTSRWSARLPCSSGAGTCSARLVIADFAGTWQDLSGSNASKRICGGGKKMPLTVQSSTREQLAFTVFGDSVSLRCPTLTILVKPVDDKTMQGSVDVGVHAGENREVHAGHSGASAATSANPANAIRLVRR